MSWMRTSGSRSQSTVISKQYTDLASRLLPLGFQDLEKEVYNPDGLEAPNLAKLSTTTTTSTAAVGTILDYQVMIRRGMWTCRREFERHGRPSRRRILGDISIVPVLQHVHTLAHHVHSHGTTKRSCTYERTIETLQDTAILYNASNGIPLPSGIMTGGNGNQGFTRLEADGSLILRDNYHTLLGIFDTQNADGWLSADVPQEDKSGDSSMRSADSSGEVMADLMLSPTKSESKVAPTSGDTRAPTSSPSAELGIGAKAGIGTGVGVVGTITIVGAGLFHFRRRKSKGRNHPTSMAAATSRNDDSDGTGILYNFDEAELATGPDVEAQPPAELPDKSFRTPVEVAWNEYPGMGVPAELPVNEPAVEIGTAKPLERQFGRL
ncbi:hypothetical protein PSPO01_04632 [Paraphaeosphaeria sporulosa]